MPGTIEANNIFLVIYSQFERFYLFSDCIEMILSANKVTFHSSLIYLAAFMNFLGMGRDEKVRIQLENLLFC
jgi:hypothetical protein